MEIIESLNNREIASAIWLIVLIICVLARRSTRKALLRVWKSLIDKKIIAIFMIMLLYIFLMIMAFKALHFWDTSAAKDTILWAIGTAAVSIFDINRAGEDGYFTKALWKNLKLALILEFVINLYPFSLPIELVFILVISALTLMVAFVDAKPEYRKIRPLLAFLLGILGLITIAFTAWQITVNFSEFLTLKNLRDLLLPPLFTISFLPYLYLLALHSQYEMLFVRLDFANRNMDVKKLKWKIINKFGLNLPKLNNFSKSIGFPKIATVLEILDTKPKS